MTDDASTPEGDEPILDHDGEGFFLWCDCPEDRHGVVFHRPSCPVPPERREAHGPWSAPESETERPETNIHPSEGATLPPSHVGGQRQAGRPTDTPDMVGSAAAGGPTPETEDGECIADRDAVAEIEADLHRMEVEISGSDPRFVSNEVRAITRHCRTLLALLRPEGQEPVARGTERAGWQVWDNVTCVECPDCAFVMAADHVDEADPHGYTCPNCDPLASPPAPEAARDLIQDAVWAIDGLLATHTTDKECHAPKYTDGWLQARKDAVAMMNALRARLAAPEARPECPDCEGLGEVYVGSSVPDDEGFDVCVLCEGSGERPDDDAIRDLRQRAWNAEGNLQAMTYERDQLAEARPEGEGFSVTMVDLESGAEVQIEPSGCEREFFLAGNGSSLVLTPLAVPAEGERIEVWTYESRLDKECSCEESRAWVVTGACKHKPGPLSANPATLILHPDTQED